MNYNDRLTQ